MASIFDFEDPPGLCRLCRKRKTNVSGRRCPPGWLVCEHCLRDNVAFWVGEAAVAKVRDRRHQRRAACRAFRSIVKSFWGELQFGDDVHLPMGCIDAIQRRLLDALTDAEHKHDEIGSQGRP